MLADGDISGAPLSGRKCLFGEGNDTPLQYSCLENPLDGGACRLQSMGSLKSQTRLSDFTFTFHFPALEKEMATHSSVLAWRIPGTGSLVGCRCGVAQSRTRLKRRSSIWVCPATGGQRYLLESGLGCQVSSGKMRRASCSVWCGPALWSSGGQWLLVAVLLPTGHFMKGLPAVAERQ